MKTNTSEQGVEALIVAQMVGGSVERAAAVGSAKEPEPFAGLDNWVLGDLGGGGQVDLTQLQAFLTVQRQPRLQTLACECRILDDLPATDAMICKSVTSKKAACVRP